MRIMFICGSLEPGRDGVGDYVSRLGAELVRQGHEVKCVAINDFYISGFHSEFQNRGDVVLPVVRISSLSKGPLLVKVKAFVQEFDPEWVSLQFVPYSFSKKGFPFLLSFYLKNIIGERKLHVMIHEIWSKQERFSLTSHATFHLQRILVKRILASIHPVIIHTHLPEYKEALERLGFEIKSLPLFSNVAVCPGTEENQNKLVIGFFSQVECCESVISFLSIIGQKALSQQVPIEIILIGGNQVRMKHFGEFLEKSLVCLKAKITYTGFLSASELSHAIQNCSIGISSLPRHALGKSGSVAAFLEHGIPIAAPCTGGKYGGKRIGFFSPELQSTIMTDPDITALVKLKHKLSKAKEEISVTKVTQTFIADIQA
jgi:hypothetical protein